MVGDIASDMYFRTVVEISIRIFENGKVDQGHSTIFEMMPFYGKCQNLQTTIFTCFIFAVLMIVTDTNGQAHGYRRNRADL